MGSLDRKAYCLYHVGRLCIFTRQGALGHTIARSLRHFESYLEVESHAL